MKKLFILIVSLFVINVTVEAQHALGVRLGGGSSYGAELSYQLPITDLNRIEFDLGWNAYSKWNNANLAAIFHWKWNIVDALDWYVGPGAMLSIYDIAGKHEGDEDFHRLGLGIGGQIGLQYTFNVPIQLSIDARPMWNFLGYAKDWGSVAFSVRYVFGR